MKETIPPTTVTTVRVPTHLYELAKRQDINFSALFRHALEASLKLNNTEMEKLNKREQELLLHQQKYDAELNLIRIRKQELEDRAKQFEQVEAEKSKLREALRNAIIILSKEVTLAILRHHAELCKVDKEALKEAVKEYNRNPASLDQLLDDLVAAGELQVQKNPIPVLTSPLKENIIIAPEEMHA